MANAVYNHGLVVDELIVAEAWVGKNLVLKRGRPRARGRFGRIFKPFAEITIKVRQELDEDDYETDYDGGPTDRGPQDGGDDAPNREEAA